MDDYQTEIAQIQQILKDNPKGMTVTDISRKIKINRNSVAKYLDIMRTSGLVEMITFGPAKVFFPSRRVPIPTMLDLTSDYILIIDKDMRIIMINDSFLDFIDMERINLIGQNIEDLFAKKFDNKIDIMSEIREAFNGNHCSKDISFKINEEPTFLKVRVVPTTFEDGKVGVTIIMKNITDQKIAEQTLRENEKQLRLLLEKLNKNKK
ncbi:MAG: PAS domain-containing protein [Candidatus Thermoplasmatota archaeon]|jgi:PAS domain S-box-containing protein|nr:PAS domain-containing protein [Candidatus Thermoplasmatota archaeon]